MNDLVNPDGTVTIKWYIGVVYPKTCVRIASLVYDEPPVGIVERLMARGRKWGDGMISAWGAFDEPDSTAIDAALDPYDQKAADTHTIDAARYALEKVEADRIAKTKREALAAIAAREVAAYQELEKLDGYGSF